MPNSSTKENKSDLELINYLRSLYQISRDDKRIRYDSWHRNARLVTNQRGAFRQANQANQPNPKDSECYPLLSSLIGWMTDQRTNIDIVSACDPYSQNGEAYNNLALDLKALISSVWYSEFFDQEIKLMLWDALQFQTGFLKVVWDQALAGGYGNAVFKRVDPWNMYVDPNATCLDDAEFIIEARRMSIDEVERRWPGQGASIEVASMLGDIDERPSATNSGNGTPKANPGSLPSGNGNWNQKTSFPNNSYNPLETVVVYEFWLKENSDYYEEPVTPNSSGNPRIKDEFPTAIPEKTVEARWRVIILAAGNILMDEYADELFSSGRHPYVDYRFEDIGEFYGVALCDHLADPQNSINRLLGALQHHAELCGNPIFIESAQSGLDRTTIINKPGQRLRLNGIGAMSNPPTWLTPPPMSSDVQGLIEFWIGRMINITGMTPEQMGHEPLARVTNDALASAQEAGFVRVRSALRNLEKTLVTATQLLCDLIIDNYTEPRIVAILGEDGATSAKLFNFRHFWVGNDEDAMPLKYALIIEAGSAMPTSRQARIAEADIGFAMGAVDRIGWYQAHQFPNWREMNDRIATQEAAGSWEPPGSRQRSKRSS